MKTIAEHTPKKLTLYDCARELEAEKRALLSALRRFVLIAQCYCYAPDGDLNHTTTKRPYQCPRCEADAAIAKAEGRATGQKGGE